MLLADYQAYVDAQDRVSEAYRDQEELDADVHSEHGESRTILVRSVDCRLLSTDLEYRAGSADMTTTAGGAMAAADGRPDFSIGRLGPCHRPSPMRGVRFIAEDERVLYPSTLGSVAQLRTEWGRSSDHGVCGPARTNLLRTVDLGVRHRHVWRPVSWSQRRHTRHRPQPPPSLRRPEDLRVPVWLRRPRGGYGGATARSIARGRQQDSRTGRVDSWILARTADARVDGRSARSARHRHPLRHRRRRHAPWRPCDQPRSRRARACRSSVIGVPKTIDNDVSFVQRRSGSRPP